MTKLFLDLKFIFWLSLALISGLIVLSSNFFNNTQELKIAKSNISIYTVVTKISQIHAVSYYEENKKSDWVNEAIILLDLYSNNEASNNSKKYIDEIKTNMLSFKNTKSNDRELMLPIIVDIGSSLNFLMTEKVAV